MAKWRVSYFAGASTSVVVDADNQEQAWEKAEEEFPSPQPCYHCSRSFELGDWEPVEDEWGTEIVED